VSTATSEGRLGSEPSLPQPAWSGAPQPPSEGDGGAVTAPDGDAPAASGPRIPLRITLVALLVALVAAALTLTGVSATSLLRGYLLDQHDDELHSALQEAQRNPSLVYGACTSQTEALPALSYFACVYPNGTGFVLVQGPGHTKADLPALGDPVLSRPDGAAQTVAAQNRSTSWRVVAGEVPGTNFTVVYAVDLAEDTRTIGRLVGLEVVVGLIVLALLGIAGYILVRNSLRPLAEVERTAQAIAAGDLSQRVPVGDERTEVGRLSRALNGMLSRIEESFRAQQASEEQARASEARMRRFVADASHELRTPLTSIRGFAELYRQGAVRTPEETRRLMQRIEAEGARMGLLVEDLLQLARLDQQRPLTILPVDLAEVAGDVVHDARAVQPDRPISLQLSESLTEVPVVLGDEARLHQVVGNLVTNALTHTPHDVRVTVVLDEEPHDPDTVVVRVADEGPGLAPEDAERVFERFYRAESSRTRENGGTGLGLAIVASLVAAHGGTVDVVTAPGRGATFNVRLPRSGPPSAGPGPAATIPG
jgi:two-component system OmpR family sensor kinase